MTSPFSAIDLQTRLEVQDLLSRFCHALDHNRADTWLNLFTADAVVEAPRMGLFRGHDEIRRIPAMAFEMGGGAWRHQLNNVCIDRMLGDRDLHIEAYCTVSDWRKGGHAVRCWDFSAKLGGRKSWKIINLLMRPVGDQARSSPCTEASAPTPIEVALIPE